MIRSVNAAWVRFARDNGAPRLAHTAEGSLLWRHVSGADVQAILRALFDRLRSSRRSVTVSYRCDSPDLRRFMQMRIVPLAGGAIELRSRTVRVEGRPRILLPDTDPDAAPRQVVMCAWCKRIKAGRWLEVEDAVPQLRLLEEPAAVGVVHGMCQDCKELLLGHI